METKINITTILKDKPKGTKLYSTVHGECTFEVITDEIFKIHFCTSKFGLMQAGECTLIKFGNMFDDGECVVFPSKEMRDWSKFAWKKGDVLIETNSEYCVGIFDKWTSDDYSTFSAKYINLGLSDNFSCSHTCKTEEWEKMKNSKNYISKIERVMNGKLNLKTLEIEKQPEFKDGDVVALDTRYIDSDDVIVESFIVRGDYKYGDDLKFYAACSNNKETDVVYNSSIIINKTFTRKESLRLSTEEEKQQLFFALAKENKRWDSEKKQIVDLKPKFDELKSFDNVLVRHQKTEEWRANIFSHTDKTDEYLDYVCVNGRWEFCIPYEGNESLLGTTKDVED